MMSLLRMSAVMQLSLPRVSAGNTAVHFNTKKEQQTKMFSLKKSVSFQIYLPICYCKYLSCRLSSSSRPIANFEPFIDDNVITSQNQQSQNNYVSVKHSGMLGNRSTVRLPDSLVEAAEKIAENRNDQNLKKIAKYLNDHLVFKKPPLTQSQIKELEANCAELIHSIHPLPGKQLKSHNSN